jgi:hypothetical protein
MMQHVYANVSLPELDKTEHVVIILKEAPAQQGHRLPASLENIILVVIENEAIKTGRIREARSTVYKLEQRFKEEQATKQIA